MRELHQDDLAFLARVFRRNAKVGIIFDMELRRRSIRAKRQAARRLPRPRVLS